MSYIEGVSYSVRNANNYTHRRKGFPATQAENIKTLYDIAKLTAGPILGSG